VLIVACRELANLNLPKMNNLPIRVTYNNNLEDAKKYCEDYMDSQLKCAEKVALLSHDEVKAFKKWSKENPNLKEKLERILELNIVKRK
jgi:hypothetical protein